MSEDLPDGNDSTLDRNQQEDDAVTGEPSHAITCTNNIEIINASNVTIGDHNTIIVSPFVRQSGECMNTLRISEGFQAMVEKRDRQSVNEETQIYSARTVVTNIVAIGDNNVICVQNSDQMLASDFQTSPGFSKQLQTIQAQHFIANQSKFPEQSTASRSGGRTAIQDRGEWRGTKRKQSKIRFPQRKCRPHPKLRWNRGSSESEDEIQRFNSPELFLTVPGDSDRMFEKSMKKFHAILNRLHPLRDRGNWSDFNSVADNILQANKSDLELEILISIEKSVVVSYQNDLERAERMVLEALKTLAKAPKVEMNNFLVTMAHCHLTGFYRRQNKHGKAITSITTAEQNSRNLNSRYVKALIYYEMASNLTKYISSIPLDRSQRDELVERAKKYMKQCINLCIELDDGRVYIKKHHFGLLKLALLDLNCRTRAARSQITSSRCIKEAKNCLRTVAGKYKDEMSEGQQIQFFVAQSDLNFRCDDLHAAQIDASHALSLAETHGFRLEVNAIKERQDDISKLITSREAMTLETSVAEEYMECLSSSTSPSQKNSPNSSGQEME